MRRLVLLAGFALLPAFLPGQDTSPTPDPNSKIIAPKSQKPSSRRLPPSSSTAGDATEKVPAPEGEGESSSRSTLIDLSAPAGMIADPEGTGVTPSGVHEMTKWNPHRAAKDIEVAEYHMKRKNYCGAEYRLRDALEYKPNDARANLLLGEVMEKTRRYEEARGYYEAYLKILPVGHDSDDARKALERMPKNSGPGEPPPCPIMDDRAALHN